MVEYLCFLTGKRQVEIEFEYSSFEEVGKQLGSIAQAGLWGVFYAEESDVRVVQAISGLVSMLCYMRVVLRNPRETGHAADERADRGDEVRGEGELPAGGDAELRGEVPEGGGA